jgi:hypothetical protein
MIRNGLLRKLLEIPDAELGSAGVAELIAMAAFYDQVKRALSADTVRNPDARVTASKLCARKRPNLLPVRDRLVCGHLGLAALQNYQVDWQIFRSLMRDHDIVATIDTMTKTRKRPRPDRFKWITHACACWTPRFGHMPKSSS